MQTKGQQQFDLSSGSHEPSIDYASADRYGQQTLPGLSQPPAKTQRSTPASTGEQLPMFMSQREIMEKYQPLDGDLQDHWQPRGGEPTGRAYTTEGYPNRPLNTRDRNAPFMQRYSSDEMRNASHYRDWDRPETHDEMMSRKLDESQMSYDEYSEVHSGGMEDAHRTPGYDTIMGGSSAPVYQSGHSGTYEYEADKYYGDKLNEHYQNAQGGQGSLYDDLAHDMRPGGPGFTGLVHLATGQFGSQGKPSIAGAHHRLAALGEIAPDRLLPVIHHNSMAEARNGPHLKNYPYT